MQETLTDKLGELDLFKEYGKKFGVSLDERELSDAEDRVLREFYGEDQLAKHVSEGKTSYTQLIRPIEEKYGSLWRRIWYPKKDKAFDDEVIRVLGSMNNVEYEHYGNPILFTTSGRRREVWEFDKGALVVSAFFAVVIGAGVYSILADPEVSRETSIYVQALTGASPAIVFAAGYAIAKFFHNSNMIWYLNHLKAWAQSSDELLREHRL